MPINGTYPVPSEATSPTDFDPIKALLNEYFEGESTQKPSKKKRKKKKAKKIAKAFYKLLKHSNGKERRKYLEKIWHYMDCEPSHKNGGSKRHTLTKDTAPNLRDNILRDASSAAIRIAEVYAMDKLCTHRTRESRHTM